MSVVPKIEFLSCSNATGPLNIGFRVSVSEVSHAGAVAGQVIRTGGGGGLFMKMFLCSYQLLDPEIFMLGCV